MKCTFKEKRFMILDRIGDRDDNKKKKEKRKNKNNEFTITRY